MQIDFKKVIKIHVFVLKDLKKFVFVMKCLKTAEKRNCECLKMVRNKRDYFLCLRNHMFPSQ